MLLPLTRPVYCVVEGHGAVYFDGERRDFAAHDCFVVPPWQMHRFTARADSDCVLFSFSDRAAQDALGFWREAVE